MLICFPFFSYSHLNDSHEGFAYRSSLSLNSISSKGAILLFDTLRECHANVESIYLTSCHLIEDSCVPSLIACIESTKITNVVIDMTRITEKNELVYHLFVNNLKQGIHSVNFYPL